MYGHAKKCHVVIIKYWLFRTWRILAAAECWNKGLSKPGPLTVLLLHNSVCRSLKLLLPQSVGLKEQMAARGWQVRCPAKAAPLTSNKVPVTAGSRWMDSLPSRARGIATCSQLFPAHSVAEQAGSCCRTARESSGAAVAGLPQWLGRPGFCCCRFAAPSERTAC